MQIMLKTYEHEFVFEKDKNIMSSLLHHCIIMCYFITILSLDILYFQHSSTILHKCKVKQEFLIMNYLKQKIN